MTHNPSPPNVSMPCERCGGVTRLPDGVLCPACLVVSGTPRRLARRHRAALELARSRDALPAGRAA